MRRFASSCPYTPVWYISRMLSGVNTLVYVEVMSDRLTKSDGIDHGLRTLANDGPNALKVGPMSATLKVSRGSFYWHFRDIADFRSQILRSWQERMTDQVIQEVAGKAEPDRLRHLLKRALVEKPHLDRAVRSWAAEDEDVATIVASVRCPQGRLHRKIVSRGRSGKPPGVASGSLHVLGLSGSGICHGASPCLNSSIGVGRHQRHL